MLNIRNNWREEVMFDIRALGSEFFFLLVFIRSLIGPYFPFVFNLVFAGLTIFIFSLLFKKFDGYVSRGVVLMFFVSNFYNSPLFYLLAVMLFVSLIFVCVYKKVKKKEIYYGILIGVVSIILGYFLGNWLTGILGLYHPYVPSI